MTDRVKIRVSMDGKEPHFELMCDGMKITELTYIEVLELSLNAVSSLRWGKPDSK